MIGLLLFYQLSFCLKGASKKLIKDDDGFTQHERIADPTEPIELNMNKFVSLGDLESANGGAILINKNKVNCVLNNCKFDSCAGTNGGAIYIMYSGSGSTYNCAITASEFTGCQSKTHGGAIYVQITQSNSHSFVVTNTEFKNNQAGKSGGAIYAMVRDTCTIQHCTFTQNSGSDVGSSLWCRIGWNDRYNLNELVIEENTFTFTPTKKSSVNVYIDTYVLSDDTTPNGNLQLGRCTFAGTKEGITGYYQLQISEHNSKFESIKFSGCNCVNDAYGTVSLPYSYNPNATFAFNCQSIGTCQLEPVEPTPGPSKDSQGFSVYPERILLSYREYPPTLTLVKAKFSNLEYLKNDIGGGAIAIDRVNCTITDCAFDHCYTSAKSFGGGAVYVYYPGTDAFYTCQIINSVFESCNVTNFGGAVFAQTVQTDRHKIIIDACTFKNNLASKLGGAIYVVSRDLISICHCTFENNNAVNGSSLYAKVGHANGKDTNDRITIFGNTFTIAPTVEKSTNVYIESVKLDENIEPRAVVYFGNNKFAHESTLSHFSLFVDDQGQLKDFVFIGYNCIQSGLDTVHIPNTVNGVEQYIIIDCPGMNQYPEPSLPPATEECSTFSVRRDEVTNLDIRNTCFADIKAPANFDGGAIRIVNAPLYLQACRFTRCSSERDGGAVYAFYTGNTCDLDISRCIFQSCTAGLSGGAVYFVNEMPTKSSITNNKFIDNEAVANGGGLFYSPSARSALNSNFFLNNKLSKSNNRGTALYAIIRNLNANINNDNVDISNNRFRSELTPNSQQFYINMKKSGRLHLGFNAFSFNKAEITGVSSKYIYLLNDEGSDFQLKGDICVDSNETRPGLVYGIDNNIKYDCHRADEEWDNYVEPDQEKELNLGLAIGIAVICGVVVIAIVIVILVVITIKDRRRNQ